MPVKQTISEKRLYMNMGFTDYQARKLLEVRDLSPDKVKDVIDKGCKIDTAYRIFRP